MAGRLWLLVRWRCCGVGDSVAGALWGPTRCMPIPQAMALCRSIGYTETQLPSLLDHDTVAKATQQPALLARECHPDAHLFLCSFFVPVCLDRAIYRCHSLCEVVQARCTPVPACYSYLWPATPHCALFPSGQDLCVATRESLHGFSLLLPHLNPTLSSCSPWESVKVRLSRSNAPSSGPSDLDLDSRLEVLRAGPLPPSELAPTLRRWLPLDATRVQSPARKTCWDLRAEWGGAGPPGCW